MRFGIGKYYGYVQINEESIRVKQGIERKYFTIIVTEFDGKYFTGEIEENALSGGMEGRGTISGEIDGQTISFVKYMPYLTMYFRNSSAAYEPRVYKERAHFPIIYTGVSIGYGNYSGECEVLTDYATKLISRFYAWLKGVKQGAKWEMSRIND